MMNPSKSLRVLIVEDNPLDRAEAKAALLHGSSNRYEFVEAASAGDALRLCGQQPLPDCIVLDLGLPDSNGLDVLAHLPRDENELLRVPVVVLTGMLQHGLNQAALRAGAHDYVCKAWLRPETLTQAVENSIERLQMARAFLAQRQEIEQSRVRALALESENHRMHEASRLKSQFLANMSHELRTPLTAIIGFAELLHTGAIPADSKDHHEFLGHIGSSGRHLLQLIDDVLVLSKVEAGKLEFFPKPLKLEALVTDVIAILNTGLQRKNLQVHVDVDPAIGTVILDPVRLKQVLFNYLSNAIKFTPKDGAITVTARGEGARHFRLAVEDTGIGIEAAKLPRLFTQYEQLDTGDGREFQGTGLGLALTRQLVEAQYGSVGVRSTPDVGSVFHVILNRFHGTDEARLHEASERLVVSAGRHFLVMQNRDGPPLKLSAALRLAGFQVDTAATEEAAVERAHMLAYDGITLDLLLSDHAGLAALDRIRRAGLSAAAPVVGLVMPGVSGTLATFAIADVLPKPIRTEQLVSAMARFRMPGTRPTNVMVIDDDPVALDLMQAMLKAIGIDAVCFLDPVLALGELDRHRPDAIVLDLMMPVFDGFAVLEALRHLPDWRDTPVFVWTAMVLSETEYDSLARSATAIISKGGGSVDATSKELRRWRPQALPRLES